MEIEKIHQEAYKQYPKMSRVSEWREKPLPAHFNSEYLGDANAEKREGFIAGAKWAEETMIDNPNERMIAKYLYEKKGYPVDLNGNLPSFEETMKDVEKYNKYKEDKFIDKAWDWIEDNLLTPNQQDKSCLYFEQFKNYMEGE